MTRQLISTNRKLLLRHVTRSVRRAAGFVQVRLPDILRFALLLRAREAYVTQHLDLRSGDTGGETSSGPLCANIPETVLVLLINEQGEKEKGRDEREFSWCCFF